jgi:hypothetical protein
LYQYGLSNPVLFLDALGLYVYKIDTHEPDDDKPFNDVWNSGGTPSLWMKLYLADIKIRASKMLLPGVFLPHAFSFLANYLYVGADTVDFSYYDFLNTSESARNWFKDQLWYAMTDAEHFAYKDGSPTPIVTISGKHETAVEWADPDWWLALQTYRTWGKGTVIKGKGRQNCCYKMEWTLNLRDNYEFEENNGHRFGNVSDREMWLLNHYGWAKHFKVRASHTITVVWPKNYRADDIDARAVIDGKLPPCPQCEPFVNR